MSRPFMNRRVAELSEIAETADRRELKQILEELSHRRTPSAQDLRKKLEGRLQGGDRQVMPKAEDERYGEAAAVSENRLPPDDPRVSFATGQIDQLRRRLLDLTGRNPLLNYKFSERARAQVRVIDELPDQLYSELQEGKTMWFKALEEPSGEPQDEQTDEFLMALESARLTDEEYLVALEELGEEDPENPKFQRLERELKDRVREALQLPPRPDRKTMSKAEVARLQGLVPTYDLPESAPQDEQQDRHQDNEIQTLLFPDEMGRKLSYLRDQTRRGLEELGINTLFAAYGFLEWYEADHSDRKFSSPLLLQPLDIQRAQKDDEYKYGVSGTGEETEVNLTLVERMKEFGLRIPDFEEEDTPESYFEKVAHAIERKDRWRVRRFIAFGIFSFGKLAMWHDLDPARWPEERALERHPLVVQLLAGVGGETGEDASDYPVDEESFEQKLPLIITDTDTSQLSAIIDAVDGKNLAIKGPPGTGKSQTITNLVAAAMQAEKSVLFVAEKMAALEVVKNRLDQFGLGDFVLELHSTKARKKDVLESLRRRLELRKHAEPQQLDAASEELRKLKRDLNEYVDLLNRSVGRSGKNFQEVIWAEIRTRRFKLPEAVDEIRLENALELTAPDITRCTDKLKSLQQAWMQVSVPGGHLEDHPWHGVTAIIPAFEFPGVLRKVGAWQRALQAIADTMQPLQETMGLSECGSQDELLAAIAALKDLDGATGPTLDLDFTILEFLKDWRVEEEAAALDAAWTRLDESEATISQAVNVDELNGHETQSLPEFIEIVRELGLEGHRTNEIDDLASTARENHETWSSLVAELRRFAGAAGVENLDHYEDLQLLKSAADLAANASKSVLSCRNAEVLSADAGERLDRLQQVAKELNERKKSLEHGLRFKLTDDSDALRHAAQCLETTGFLVRPFSSDYKAARRLALPYSTDPKIKMAELARKLRHLSLFLRDAQNFAQNREGHELLGPSFDGVATDFESVKKARQLCLAAKNLARSSGVGTVLRDFLIKGSSEAVRSFGQRYDERCQRLLEQVITAVQGVAIRSLSELAAFLKNRAERKERLKALIGELSILPDFPMKDASDVQEALKLRRALLESEIPRLSQTAGLLEPYQFVRKNPILREQVLNLIARIACPKQGFKKEAWREHLFTREISQRLSTTVAKAGALDEAISFSKEYQRDVIDALQLDGAFDEEDVSKAPVQTLQAWCDSALAAPEGLDGWSGWLKARADVDDEGLSIIVDAYQRAGHFENIEVAFQRALWRSIIRKVYDDHPRLMRFTGVEQEKARKRFRELDKQIIELNREKLAADLSQRIVPRGLASGPKGNWTDKALIQHHANLQRPRIPIRKLVARGHSAMQALKPCWMMSPGSIAQFMPPGEIEFDLVVIDEASQMKPEDALSAAARGKQIVVVGDPMQLPPTSFFDRANALDGEEDEEEVEAESVLDLALSVYQPARQLNWHYRSRHESLVAFSNKEFYEGRLVVFPSPEGASKQLGVKFRHVQGIYRGKGGNTQEVDTIAHAALEHMRQQPDQSLGVVAVNRDQADLLSAEIDRLLLHDVKAQEFMSCWEQTIESFFVKNLETVQGDERDVIMISTVYGPNQDGNLYQRFGPINSKVGHRRLNVLFTRAKRRVDLFTSLSASDVQLSEHSNWGVRALKGYLEFAATGRLEAGTNGGEPENDFELSVAEALQAQGYRVVPQVGVAGFRIDLGVEHPDWEHGYLLGVECDGATYHSAKSARDRDALRQEILERLGWNLYRIWSTDWFNDPRGETRKMIEHIENLRVTRVQAVNEHSNGRA